MKRERTDSKKEAPKQQVQKPAVKKLSKISQFWEKMEGHGEIRNMRAVLK
jgi:hypothetical protein